MNNEILPFVETKMGRVVTNSRAVAAYFEKEHKHVLRDIDHLLAVGGPDLDPLLIEREDYHVQARKIVRSFDMTKDGFTILAMGYTGPKAIRFKLAYIKRFNEMEETLRRQHRTAYLGGVVVREFHLNGERLRAVATDRGPFILACDLVPLVYENARLNNTPAGSYTKDIKAGEKIILSPHDAPALFEGQPNCQFQALSLHAVYALLKVRGNGGRGGAAQAARKDMIRGWMDSEVFPELRSIQPECQSVPPQAPKVEPNAAMLREQAERLLAAASALDALEDAKALAAKALRAIA